MPTTRFSVDVRWVLGHVKAETWQATSGYCFDCGVRDMWAGPHGAADGTPLMCGACGFTFYIPQSRSTSDEYPESTIRQRLEALRAARQRSVRGDSGT